MVILPKKIVILKRQTSEQSHMNTKLFVSEQLRKIFTSAELLEKKSILK